MDRFRHWLMGVIAGKKFAWWIKDSAAERIESLGSVAGVGAAIVLASTARKNKATEISFVLDNYEITVRERAKE